MKKLFTLLCFTVVTSVSFGQLRLALTGGPHYSSILEKNNMPGWDSAYKPGYSNRGGFNAGLMAEIPLDANRRWFLQPGVFYMTKGRKYSRSNDTAVVNTDTLSYKSNFFTNYIDIPVNITYKLRLGRTSNFFLSAGPYVSFFYTGKQINEARVVESDNSVRNKKTNGNIESGSGTWKVSTFDYGVNARAGFELGSFIVSGYASQGLNNFYNAPYDGTFKHRVMGVSVGFWLNKSEAQDRKVRDRDKDGVDDNDDACPGVAGPAITNGCPDKDGDGVVDYLDKCPDLSGSVKNAGCPVADRDKDGVADDEDHCPDQPGLIRYKGCPVPDSDGDGVSDEQDKCPNEAGPANNLGCPIPDRDGDGVNDRDDKCPSTKGTVENNGCPAIRKDIIDKVNFAAHNTFFGRNSADLTPATIRALNKVVGILKSNPGFKLTVEGHSDNTGKAEHNLALSQKRADEVKKYLVRMGVDGSRLQAIGYGQQRPVADNSTPNGRAANRRVEMKLSNDGVVHHRR